MKTRSVSKHGEPELGEPHFSRQQLGTFHEKFVERMRDAITAGLERAVEGVDRRPGTKRPRTFDPARGVLP
jgi:hypothetical protein